MKTKSNTIVGMVLCIIGLLFFNLNPVSAQVAIKYLGGVHGPVDSTTLSPSFVTFRDNRGQQMLGQIAGTYSNRGIGYSQSLVSVIDYSKMVVTPSSESWHGILAPGSNEHGNVRYDQGFYLYINGGTFVPSQVSVNTRSEIWNGTAWITYTGAININTTLGTINTGRIRMNTGTNGISGDSDDQVHSVQTGSQPATGFVFIGPAVGLTPFGTGNSQQQIQNTIDWMTLNKFRLVHTVSGTSTLGSFSFTKANEVPSTDLKGLEFKLIGNPGGVSWKSDGYAYMLQRSFNNKDWTDLKVFLEPTGTTVTEAVSVIEGQPKAFWRLCRQ